RDACGLGAGARADASAVPACAGNGVSARCRAGTVSERPERLQQLWCAGEPAYDAVARDQAPGNDAGRNDSPDRLSGAGAGVWLSGPGVSAGARGAAGWGREGAMADARAGWSDRVRRDGASGLMPGAAGGGGVLGAAEFDGAAAGGLSCCGGGDSESGEDATA